MNRYPQRSNNQTRYLSAAHTRAATILLALISAAATASTALACPTAEGWQIFSVAEYNPGGMPIRDQDYDGGFGGQPQTVTQNAATGGNTADSSMRMDDTGLHSSWTHHISNAHGGETRTALIYEFHVDHSTTFNLSGMYTMVGAGRMSAIIDLWDMATATRFFFQQIDGNEPNQSLTVGQPPLHPGSGGSVYQMMHGALSGVFVPGTRYRLDVDLFVATGSPGSGFDATGFVNLDMVDGDDPNCPAPGAMSLALLSSLLATRRRRAL